MIRLWCATVLIFDHTGTKTVLINHRKLGRWVPPGGKIDPNEIPDDAAIRECKEETGLDIVLVGETPAIEGCKVRPIGVQINTVVPYEKQHIDLMYVAIPKNSMDIVVNTKEASAAHWFTIDEVTNPAFNTFDSVRQWVNKISDEWSLFALPHEIKSFQSTSK